MSLEIKPNTMVAIVGKSGEGKSTILKLIGKNYEINNGKIFIDDRDINKYLKRLLEIIFLWFLNHHIFLIYLLKRISD